MKKHLKISFVILGIIGFFSTGTFLLFKNPSTKTDNGETIVISQENNPLFVSLANTVNDRNAFMETYTKATDKNHLRTLYEEYLPKIGANGLIDSIETITPLCHDEGHDLGKVIYAELTNSGSALATCNDACSSGCMHGVLMEFFGEDAGGEGGDQHTVISKIAEKIPTFCNNTSITDLYLPGDCAHGIGHALMYLADYDIPTAIEACDKLDTYPMQYYCATGAYMEYNTNRYETDRIAQPTLYPCSTSPYPAACFRYKMVGVFRYLYASGEKFSVVRDQCLALTVKNTRLGCFHGIGNAHMVYIASGKISIAKVCSAGTDDDIYACIDGAMERLGKYYPAQVESSCATLEDGWKKDLCLAAGARKMYDLEKSFELYQR